MPSVTGVVFGVETNVPVKGGNAAQSREHDKRIGAGTMSRAGAQVPLLRDDHDDGGHPRRRPDSGRLRQCLTAVVVDGRDGKEYRLPTDSGAEHRRLQPRPSDGSVFATAVRRADRTDPEWPRVVSPDGSPFTVFTIWHHAFGRSCSPSVNCYAWDRSYAPFADRESMRSATTVLQRTGCRGHLQPALCGSLDRLADSISALHAGMSGVTAMRNTFSRFALPITWDFCGGESTRRARLVATLSAWNGWPRRWIVLHADCRRAGSHGTCNGAAIRHWRSGSDRRRSLLIRRTTTRSPTRT